jgi:putative peptidoglycan lipid II flippase
METGQTADSSFLRDAKHALDNRTMFLKAGAVSLGLLLVSRLLGLMRESAQAAAFGTSGLADVVVLMLTLPDWLTGLVASGALAFALLPAWTGRAAAEVRAIQRRVAVVLIGAGVLLALAVILARQLLAALLAGGLPLQETAAAALVWSALALPSALLAALWVTRLQHERDFVGMYGANLMVNLVLVVAIGVAALLTGSADVVPVLGAGLLIAMALRLVWLRWRQGPAQQIVAMPEAPFPDAPVWSWAALSAGLPLALPFIARTIASHGGEGALATFNYAWKLVELPLVLAIQLVASLAFPAVAAALSPQSSASAAEADAAVSSAFSLAWTLACACAAGLLAGAAALADLLFGWGRMSPDALARVSTWGRAGAWGLLPQALIAVALTVLACRGRMAAAVLGYVLALVVLLAVGAAGVVDGAALMHWLNILLGVVALVTLWAVGPDLRRWLPWREAAVPLVALVLVAALSAGLPVVRAPTAGLAWAVLCAGLVLGSGWLGSKAVRRALRR